MTVVSNLASISFTYLDADGRRHRDLGEHPDITVNAVGQPMVQPTTTAAGRALWP